MAHLLLVLGKQRPLAWGVSPPSLGFSPRLTLCPQPPQISQKPDQRALPFPCLRWLNDLRCGSLLLMVLASQEARQGGLSLPDRLQQGVGITAVYIFAKAFR